MATLLSPSDDALQRLASEVLAGSVVAFPTDTVYGLGALLRAEAVGLLYEVKGRPLDKPVPLLLADTGLLTDYVPSPSPLIKELAHRYWPGPLTLIVRGREDVALAVGSHDGTIGVRVPDDDVLRQLLRLCGGALAVTSANRSGEPPARSAMEVQRAVGAYVPYILDGGSSTATGASTVLDLAHDTPRVLRAGPLAIELAALIEEPGADTTAPRDTLPVPHRGVTT